LIEQPEPFVKVQKIRKQKVIILERKVAKMLKRKNQIPSTMSDFVAILSLVLSLQLVLCDNSSNSTAAPPTISDLNIIKNEVSDYIPTTTSSSVNKQKPMYSTGNELWDNLIRDCLRKPTFSCIQKNVYTYLDSTLARNDVNVTSRVQLTRNQLDYEIPEEAKDEENEIYFEGRGKLRARREKTKKLLINFRKSCFLS
jgi:Protein of unknown function (DUF1676)